MGLCPTQLWRQVGPQLQPLTWVMCEEQWKPFVEWVTRLIEGLMSGGLSNSGEIGTTWCVRRMGLQNQINMNSNPALSLITASWTSLLAECSLIWSSDSCSGGNGEIRCVEIQGPLGAH